mgnify:CR=1 FL=1
MNVPVQTRYESPRLAEDIDVKFNEKSRSLLYFEVRSATNGFPVDVSEVKQVMNISTNVMKVNKTKKAYEAGFVTLIDDFETKVCSREDFERVN